jgi:hypothetical protein
MSTETKGRQVRVHLTVFLFRERDAGDHYQVNITMTPERLSLLGELVKDGEWKRNLGTEPATWDAVQEAITEGMTD